MSPASPRVVIAAPLYNNAGHVAEAIESLLVQEFDDFQLMLIDDGSPDETANIAREYTRRDPRVHFHQNTQRLGYVRNARRAFELALANYPDAEYFAWASDHDAWHPRWLSCLVNALDAAPRAVLAYPISVRIDDLGSFKWKYRTFQTRGVDNPLTRMRMSVKKMRAGDMVYGLFRARALAACGPMPLLLLPDRLLLSRLALHGEFHQVPEVLWYRRYWGLVSKGRQRASFFPEGAPAITYAPVWMTHVASLARTDGINAAAIYGQISVVMLCRRHAVLLYKRWRRQIRPSIKRVLYGLARRVLHGGPARLAHRLRAGSAAPQ